MVYSVHGNERNVKQRKQSAHAIMQHKHRHKIDTVKVQQHLKPIDLGVTKQVRLRGGNEGPWSRSYVRAHTQLEHSAHTQMQGQVIASNRMHAFDKTQV